MTARRHHARSRTPIELLSQSGTDTSDFFEENSTKNSDMESDTPSQVELYKEIARLYKEKMKRKNNQANNSNAQNAKSKANALYLANTLANLKKPNTSNNAASGTSSGTSSGMSDVGGSSVKPAPSSVTSRNSAALTNYTRKHMQKRGQAGKPLIVDLNIQVKVYRDGTAVVTNPKTMQKTPQITSLSGKGKGKGKKKRKR